MLQHYDLKKNLLKVLNFLKIYKNLFIPNLGPP